MSKAEVTATGRLPGSSHPSGGLPTHQPRLIPAVAEREDATVNWDCS
jgi:hypothetical protein